MSKRGKQSKLVENGPTSMHLDDPYTTKPPLVKPLTLKDLNDYTNSDDNSRAEKILGAPLQHIVGELADHYVRLNDIRNKFKTAESNPVYTKEEHGEIFKNIHNLLQLQAKCIRKIISELDKISLEG